MKSLSVKVSLIIVSYTTLIALIVLSYISIVPNDEVIILENKSPLVKKIENKLGSKNETVYKILEKPKKIEDIIENEISDLKNVKNITEDLKKNYRLQLASFKDENKSKKISKNFLKNNFFKDNKIDLDIKKIKLKNDQIYFRVISSNFFSLAKANSHCETLKKIEINCIVIKEK